MSPKDQLLSLADLIEPDDGSLRFTPLGLSTGGRLRPEDSAKFLQGLIDRARLDEGVPESVRKVFERLRKIHAYGLFEYELSVAADQAYLVLEAALRVRFVTLYDHKIPFVKGDERESLGAQSFNDVYDAVRDRHRFGGKGWRLLSRDGLKQYSFRGSMPELLGWARGEGLLTGQRNAVIDEVFVRIRHRVAHPEFFTLVSPIDSARAISDIGEVINKLWGRDTPGGRLYPAPVPRVIRILGVAPDHSGSIEFPNLEQLPEAEAKYRGWTYAIFLAVEREELTAIGRTPSGGIEFAFQAGFETTLFPCKLLWGPGAWADAIEALRQNRESWQTDSVQYLDRLFAIRTENESVDLPRSLRHMLALSPGPPTGNWSIVKADFPVAAQRHVLHAG